jgi:hypothetical protein
MPSKRAKNVTNILGGINDGLKKYGSYYSCSRNGTPHTSLIIVKGHYKSLSQINIDPEY